MARPSTNEAGLENIRDAVTRGAWGEVHRALSPRDRSELSAEELEALADAAWWLSRLEESIAARASCHAAYLAAGEMRRAAFAAWHLCYEHYFKGQMAMATGWLRRADRHLANVAESPEHGYLALARSELARARGDQTEALGEARRATELGHAFGDRNLASVGIEFQGRAQIAAGRISEGIALLDEAMVAVVSGELSPLFTGWIYCDVLSACSSLADLRRAGEWTDAALRWSETLAEGGGFYSGLCRVYRMEVVSLRGDWARAEAQLSRACEELLAYDPQFAADAYYLAGEIRRRMGDFRRAETSFRRAAELGRQPHPGLALIRFAQGRHGAAVAALRLALAARDPLHSDRAPLLAAMCEVAAGAGDRELATSAVEELEAIATAIGTEALQASACTARGRLLLMGDESTAGFRMLRQAVQLWELLHLPYEGAKARLLLSEAARGAGDEETATLERERARAALVNLGAEHDVAMLDAQCGGQRPLPRGLTPREVEVLRLVALGQTNSEIAGELLISTSTVARHISNILGKLGVPSRAAATAFAVERRLL